MTAERISQAGDVNIDEVTIITSRGFAQEITPQIIGIEIYEDMFGSFITGKLIVKDSQEISNLLPLIGEETVRIRVSTPTLPEKDAYIGEYFIYKMDDKIKAKEREVIYVLHFMSKDAINDLNKKISKAYGGKISDTVVKILKDAPEGLLTSKQVYVEETKNTTKYTSNFWTPLQNIQFLCEQAVNENDSPSYVFFENKYGLNFVSLDSMYAGAPLMQRFKWDNYSAEFDSPKEGGGTSTSLEKDYQRIIEFNTPEMFDYIKRIQSGMYGSEIIYYDIMTKQYVHKAFGTNWQEGNHLNQYPLYSDSIPVRSKALMIHEHQYYNNFENFDVTSNTKSIQKRKALIAQAHAFKISISVFGRTDYSAGQKVYLEIPKNTQLRPDDPDWEDKLMSGTYLIGAICHFITREKHECTMELFKDSYLVDLNDPK